MRDNQRPQLHQSKCAHIREQLREQQREQQREQRQAPQQQQQQRRHRFEHLLYISCCPASLKRDIAALNHQQGEGRYEVVLETERMVLLDHFPYTEHAECAVWLRRRRRERRRGSGAGVE